MKFWKESLLTAFGFIAIASTVLYQSCTPDQCASVNCYNGAVCNAGVCGCSAGYEGSDCSQLQILKFIGTYVGSNACDANPVQNDTVDIYRASDMDLYDVKIVQHSNISDVLSGSTTAGVTSIYVPDSGQGNYYRRITVTLDNSKLIIYNQQQYQDVRLNIVKTVCTFTGTKVSK